MGQAGATLRVCRQRQSLAFRVEGAATMLHSLPLRELVELALAEERLDSLAGDLRACSYMDSTFLGTLICLRKQLVARKLPPLALLEPSEACHKLLVDMRLDSMFRLAPVAEFELPELQPAECSSEEEAPAPQLVLERLNQPGWHLLLCQQQMDAAWRANLFETHEELAKVDGPTGQRFRPIADRLAEELRTRGE